jgi:hypothetical protein
MKRSAQKTQLLIEASSDDRHDSRPSRQPLALASATVTDCIADIAIIAITM